jgi:hypothetical protein
LYDVSRGRTGYLKDVDDHVPLTTVADEVVRQEINQSVVERLLGILDGEFEIIVGLVQFIPKEQVGLCTRAGISHSPNQTGIPGSGAGTCLRELDFGYVEFLHDLVPKHVGGSEKPTSPAVLLVSPGTSLEVDDVVEDMLVGNLGCTAQ